MTGAKRGVSEMRFALFPIANGQKIQQTSHPCRKYYVDQKRKMFFMQYSSAP